MYEVQIVNRAPEGVRGFKKFRLTKAGSDELHKRMVDNVPFAELLTGIELQADEAMAELVKGIEDAPAPTKAKRAAKEPTEAK